MPAAGFLHAVERGNVRMIERGEHFRFALEAGHTIRIEQKRLRQYLDRDLADQLRVARTIDHPSRPRRGRS